MRIKVADHAGFCFGVKEAIRKTEATIEEWGDAGTTICTCGQLIHNKAVTDDLAKKGVGIIQSPDEAKEGTILIVRSHGETKQFYEIAEKRGVRIVDATCPFVSRIHKIVQEAGIAGRNIVVIGNPDHPEVKGIVGWAGERCTVIDSLEMAEAIRFDTITLVSQTTIAADLWKSIENYLKQNKQDIETIRTICNATTSRQTSCEQLAKESDAMVVIGDRNSENTKQLLEIASQRCKKTFFVEKLTDLPLKELQKYDRIGVAAGASTPERIIKEVIATMSEVITENKELQEELKEEVQQEEVQEVVQEEVQEEVQEVEAEVDEVVEVVAEPVEVVEVKEAVAEVQASDDDESADEESNMMHDFMDQIDKSLRLPNRGEIIEGEIVQVTDKEIVVNLGCKKDGVIPKDEMVLEGDKELTELFQAGQMIQAKVIKTDDGDGNILLSRKKLEVNEHWDEINEALDNRTVVNAKVVKEVKGGVIAVYKEVSGFIPMSQLSDRYVEKADEFIGKTLPVKVSRVDQKRNKAVFSHKAFLAEEKQKLVQQVWDALNVGDIVEGTVMRFTEYGAFVDIGGLDGLLHISEISWGKLKHPQEALEIGEKINVRILSMNTEKGKISLGLKQNQPEPWSIIENKYQVNDVIYGKVVQIKEYGAFVELEPGLDGLVHISEIAHKRVTDISEEIAVGETVTAKILDIDKERKRISLSIKDTKEPSLLGDDEEGIVEAISEKLEDVVETVAETFEKALDVVEEKLEDIADKDNDDDNKVAEEVETVEVEEVEEVEEETEEVKKEEIE